MAEMSVPGERATLPEWAAAIAAADAAPAGGAAAALSGALAAAAVEMVAGLTLQRERHAAEHERAAAVRERAAALREALPELARRDAETFAAFGRALALPRGTASERAARDQAKRSALRDGATVQLALLRHLAEAAELAVGMVEHGLPGAIGDAAAGGFLAGGAARSAYWAVRSNLQELPTDDESRSELEESLSLLEGVEAAEWRIRQRLSERIR